MRNSYRRSVSLILILAFIAGGCKTSKQLAYFQDLPENRDVNTVNSANYVPLKLEPNDEVQITISSTSPEAAQFFNLITITQSPAVTGNMAPTHSSGFVNLYRVSTSGNVTIPVLVDIKALGLTTEDLKNVIATKLKDYLKNSVVTVTLTNFKVTVIGEVNRPVVIPVNGQAINVLEAIGAGGDMTVFGIRKNVKVVRKLPDGTTEVAVLDFNKSNVMTSPYYQLKQNDIVYVQPNTSKGILGTRTNVWVPILTSIISIAAIIVTRS